MKVLMEGKEVKWWMESERLKGLDEKNLVERRFKDFESAMEYLSKYLKSMMMDGV